MHPFHRVMSSSTTPDPTWGDQGTRTWRSGRRLVTGVVGWADGSDGSVPLRTRRQRLRRGVARRDDGPGADRHAGQLGIAGPGARRPGHRPAAAAAGAGREPSLGRRAARGRPRPARRRLTRTVTPSGCVIGRGRSWGTGARRAQFVEGPARRTGSSAWRGAWGESGGRVAAGLGAGGDGAGVVLGPGRPGAGVERRRREAGAFEGEEVVAGRDARPAVDD